MAGWDVHTHLVPPTVLAAAYPGVSVSDGFLVVDDARLPLRRLGDPSALLSWVSSQGLDGAVVSVPPPLFRYGQPRSWTDLVNDGLRELADRFRVLGHVPLDSPVVAAEVAAKLLSSGEFSGLALGTSVPYDSPELEPLWSVLDAAGAFVLVHPGHCSDPRLSPYYLANLLGNPYETAVAAAGLVFGDVIGRFPRIRFCLCHGGGVTASVVGRWQRGLDTSRPGIKAMRLSPREAVRQMYADDLVHDPAVLDLVLETFGDDHVLAGSDWPFPMGSDTVDNHRATLATPLLPTSAEPSPPTHT
jgi:aminocarboxymuconate-semialdehyde decarboxylase